MTVLRQVVGETLRAVRLRQRRTLREVSSTARVSLGYLSEVERGQKEPSSELLAAICGALDVELSELFREVTDTLYREEKLAVRVAIGVAHGHARHLGRRRSATPARRCERCRPSPPDHRHRADVDVRARRHRSRSLRAGSVARHERGRVDPLFDTLFRGSPFRRRHRVGRAGAAHRHAQPGRQRDGPHAGGPARPAPRAPSWPRHQDHDGAGRAARRRRQGDVVQPLPYPRRRAGRAAGDEVDQLIERVSPMPLDRALTAAPSHLPAPAVAGARPASNRPRWPRSARVDLRIAAGAEAAGDRGARSPPRASAAPTVVLRWLASYLVTPAGAEAIAADVSIVLAGLPLVPAHRSAWRPTRHPTPAEVHIASRYVGPRGRRECSPLELTPGARRPDDAA